jgi:hemerythrin superfamily protein
MAMQTVTNPVELLKADHRKVKQLFSQFESAGEKEKAGIFAEIARELQVHTKVEEEIFYPAVKKMDSDMALEAEEEHNIVDWIIAQMKKLSPSDENYDAKFTTLKENVEHHIEEEEKEMFPEAEQKLPSKQMDDLGKKMMARKEALMKRATASASATPRSRAAAKPRSRAKAASR